MATRKAFRPTTLRRGASAAHCRAWGRTGALLLFSGLGIGSNCSDPPGGGSIRVDMDRVNLLAGFSAVDFTVQQVQLYYDTTPPAPMNHRSCDATGAVVPGVSPGPIHLDLTSTGRTFLGGFPAPSGHVTEIRLLVNQLTITKDGRALPAEGQLECHAKDEPRDASLDHSDDEEDDDSRAILRLIPATGQNVVVPDGGNVEVAAQFDPNIDILFDDDGGLDGGRVGSIGIDGSNQCNGARADAGLQDPGNQGSQGNQGGGQGNQGNQGNQGDQGNQGNQGSQGCQDGEDEQDDLSLASQYPLKVVPPADQGAVIPGQVIVRFKDGTSADTITSDLAAQSATMIGVLPEKSYFVLQLPQSANLEDAIKYYAGLGEVSYALPNTRLLPPLLPNDPGFSSQQSQWNQIKAPQAWDTTTGSVKPVVAIIDTGADLAHADLIDNMFLNKKEIPAFALVRNGTPIAVDDLDLNHDSVITFAELNDPANAGVCPKANHAPTDKCDPLDLVDGSSHQPTPIQRFNCNKKHIDCPSTTPVRGYGWQDGVDEDMNGYPDDLVGWDFADNTNLPVPISTSNQFGVYANHGTATAGIVGAVGNNAVDLSGVNWTVRVLPLRMYATDGSGDRFFANVAAQYALEIPGVSVILIEGVFYLAQSGAPSIGPSGCGTVETNISSNKFGDFSTPIQQEFNDIYGGTPLGVPLVVTPVGDCNVSLDDSRVLSWPSSTNAAGLRVAGVDSSGAIFQSSFGANHADIAAPSSSFTVLQSGGGTVAGFSATSAASAIVAGGAALVLAADPSLSGKGCALADRILRNADSLASLNTAVDHGRQLDVQAAVLDTNMTPVRTCP